MVGSLGATARGVAACRAAPFVVITAVKGAQIANLSDCYVGSGVRIILIHVAISSIRHRDKKNRKAGRHEKSVGNIHSRQG